MTIEELEAQLGINYAAAINQKIASPLLNQKAIQLYIKRDDLLHPIISGNKWRKLKYNILHAINHGYESISTMGGAWSNHLHALAYVGHQLNIDTVAYVRGEPPLKESPTLNDVRNWGMQINYVSRDRYRELRHSISCETDLSKQKTYWLPEGSANPLALSGIAELSKEIKPDSDIICVACGTGTTLAGLISNSNAKQTLLGFAALKAQSFLKQDITEQLEKDRTNNWALNFYYHFGGFAKTTPALQDFIQHFYQLHDIQLDRIYTGKLFYGLFELIKNDYFPADTCITAIHTGGLQGNREI